MLFKSSPLVSSLSEPSNKTVELETQLMRCQGEILGEEVQVSLIRL